jgi:POT family proton-dependent oligopeptide transporter
MWERFSYYGMRALLIFYLVQHWMFSDGEASVIYGAYTALVYITPVVGGYLADRYLGQRKAVLFGAVLLTFGHFLMAFEGSGGGQADPSINIFWLALAFIIVGSGFLKANISVIVGQLYPRTDVRRDGAYTIFYMGINLGAALGSIIAGYLGQTYGWSWGFGAAGVGMLFGLLVFIWGKPYLLGRGEPAEPARLQERTAGLKLEWLIYLGGIALVGLCWLMVQNQSVVGTLLGVFGAILVLYVLFTAVTKLEPHDRDRIFAAMFLIFGSILFWALFEQAGSSLNLFTDRHVDRTIFGFDVPASVFQSNNAIYIVLLAPVFAGLWTWLGRHGLEPSVPLKFAMGLAQLGLGFLVLVAGSAMGDLTPVLFIFLIYLLHTTGELCLSPVGLSAMNRLAPSHLASLIMGTWFFASATGNFAAGLIASATGAESASGEAATKQVVLDVYTTVGWVAIGVAVAVMLLAPAVNRLMHLDTLGDDNVGDDLVGQKEFGEAAAAGIHPPIRE